MSFSLSDITDELARLEDQATADFADLGAEASSGLDRLGTAVQDGAAGLGDAAQDLARANDDILDGSVFRDVWARSGFGGAGGDPGLQADFGNLNDIAELAEDLPFGLGGPDSTGEVPVASADLARGSAILAASLAASARIVAALGEDNVATVSVRGQDYAYYKSYADPVSGFHAIRLSPLAGGSEIFVVDGLEVGSRADEAAAATLGRLQVESDAFAAMVAEAATVGLAQGRPVLFAGPSLGGAVAQVAAYELAEDYVQANAGFGPFAVMLATVDPLGGRDAAEAINGGSLDPRALGLIAGLNIRTEGDVVSRIGSHIGATKTLPALDAAGRPVTLDAAEAHVNVVSLLQTLDSSTIWDAAPLGAPAEISGFAAAANAAAQGVIEAWLASGESETGPPRALQVPGTARFDATGTVWSLDADDNGSTDITVALRGPVDPGRLDLVLG